jgi:2-C-methyl-D-erythritol 2,4-cyclodiphosphate synthase
MLLKEVVNLLREHQYKIGNIDLTIIAQAPKLASYIPAMRQILAQDLQTEISNISVKATTTEKMGFTGRGEGIAVMANVILTA